MSNFLYFEESSQLKYYPILPFFFSTNHIQITLHYITFISQSYYKRLLSCLSHIKIDLLQFILQFFTIYSTSTFETAHQECTSRFSIQKITRWLWVLSWSIYRCWTSVALQCSCCPQQWSFVQSYAVVLWCRLTGQLSLRFVSDLHLLRQNSTNSPSFYTRLWSSSVGRTCMLMSFCPADFSWHSRFDMSR